LLSATPSLSFETARPGRHLPFPLFYYYNWLNLLYLLHVQVGTFGSIVGRGGQSLDDKWADGIETFLGVHSRGFPNFFIMAGPQGQVQ
jgi:hypothetical protein